jgi:hypothetical protein
MASFERAGVAAGNGNALDVLVGWNGMHLPSTCAVNSCK